MDLIVGAGVAENGCRGNARADAAGGCRRGAEPQGRACRVLCQEGQVAGRMALRTLIERLSD